MTDISKTYINALLADATYKNLKQDMIPKDIVEALKARMTPTLAQYIGDNFEVISAIDSPDKPSEGSGFDATVFKGRAGTEFEGQVFVSMRGTESDAEGADFFADADLALGVAAREQIVDMVNWWLKESTSTSAQAKQIKWTLVEITEEINGVPVVVDSYDKIELAAPVTGTGKLLNVTSVQVNGHSLGGHLASSFARIFGGEKFAEAGSVQIDGVSTFNSAGFFANRHQAFFSSIEDLLDTGMSSFAGVQGKQNNFFATNGINVTTNDIWFRQIGERIGVYQEEGFADANHSMYRLTDVLALGAALNRLDPDFDMGRLNTLMPLGSNKAAGSIEGLFDALRRVVEGPSITLRSIDDEGKSVWPRMVWNDCKNNIVAASKVQAANGSIWKFSA